MNSHANPTCKKRCDNKTEQRREEMVKAVLSSLGMSRSEFLLAHVSDVELLAGKIITLADEIIEQLDNQGEKL